MSQPQCLLYSAAMVLDHDVDTLTRELGHDGLEVWWPEYDDHRQYRSFAMQEMVDIFLKHDRALVPIQCKPMQAPDHKAIARLTYTNSEARFKMRLAGHKAILIGVTRNGNGHAWAWDGFSAYDPRGMSNISLDDLILREAWVMHIITS